MLTTLRNSAQSWLIKLLLGLIVITFIISFGIGTFSSRKEVLVKVGSEEILVNQFLRQYQEQLDQLRQRFPKNADALAKQLNLREQVMNRLVNRQLLLDEAQRQGLRVSQAELRDAIRSQAAFQVNHHFDFRTYRTILQQNNLTPPEYESRVHNDLLMGKLQRNLLAGVIVNSNEVNQRYQIENQRVEVSYLFVDPARFPLAKPPTLKAQKAFYQKHQDQFTQPDQFKVRYFILTLGDLEKTSTVPPRAVQRYYERNLDTEFTTPRRVRASHILKRLPKDASPKAVQKARKELQGVLAQARAGKDFAALAKKYSDDMTRSKGGDLGWFSRDEMVAAFSDAAFALKKGQISNIVRTPFGLDIIKLTGDQPRKVKPLEAVKPEIVAKLRTERAQRRLGQDVQRLPTQIEQQGLDAVAKELGLQATSSPWFDGAQVLPGLGSTAPLYDQVKRRRRNAVGVWRRNPVQGDVFYQVQDKKAAFVKPFDTVQKDVAKLTAAEQRREAALAEAKAVYPKLKSPSDFRAFARRRGLTPKTVSFTAVDNSIEGLGINRDFQRAAFGLTAKAPFALSIKDNQAYLLEFKRRYYAEPDKAEELKKKIAASMEETLRKYVLDAEINRLRNKVQIKVLAPQYLASTSGGSAPARAY